MPWQLLCHLQKSVNEQKQQQLKALTEAFKIKRKHFVIKSELQKRCITQNGNFGKKRNKNKIKLRKNSACTVYIVNSNTTTMPDQWRI